MLSRADTDPPKLYMLYFFRILLLLAISVTAAFSSLSYRTGGIAPRDFTGSAPLKTAKSWQTSHSDTLVALAKQAYEVNDQQLAETLTIQALSKDITNGHATAQLLQIYSATGHRDDAENIAKLADSLWLSSRHVRSVLAYHWSRTGKIPKLIVELDRLLRSKQLIAHKQNPEKKIFPILRQIIHNPDTFHLFQPYIETPPSWWLSFFRFLVQNDKKTDVIDKIYAMRGKTNTLPTKAEHDIYIRRLIKDQNWSKAHHIWLKKLDKNQLKLNKLLYDGSFEEKEFRSDFFGWQVQKGQGVSIKLRKTAGVIGEQALRISFEEKKPIHFRHIRQTTILQPGKYKLLLQYKLHNFRTNKGLSWRIYCATGKRKVLGEGPELRGHQPWNNLHIEFVVPEDCPTQHIRLEASSPHIHDHVFQGTLWFDNLRIERIF